LDVGANQLLGEHIALEQELVVAGKRIESIF